MQGLKEKLHASIDQLPARLSMEDAIYRLYVMQKVERAEVEIAQGKVYTHEEALREIKSWVSKSSGRTAPSKISKNPRQA
jgi:predicted transcriptional regulator